MIRLCTPVDRRDDTLGDLEEDYRRNAAASPRRAWLTAHIDAVLIAVTMVWQRLCDLRPSALRDVVSSTDLRLGVRLMYRQPILTVTAVVSLTVGIALATVGFAFMEALLYSRLPFEGGDRFVQLQALEQPAGSAARLTLDEYTVLAAQASKLEHLGGVTGSRENITLPSGQIVVATTTGLTPSTLRYLPYAPMMGRLLASDDAEPGSPRAVMVREGFWRNTMGASPDVLGSTVTIAGRDHVIVGVAPNTFEFPNSPDFWLPVGDGFLTGRSDPTSGMRLLGILAAGESIETLQRQLDVISTALPPRTPSTIRLEATSFTDLGPMGTDLATATVLVVVAILLVIAANVGNLILARSFARAREFALRSALGASRARLVAQVTLEVLAMACVAAPLGAIGANSVLGVFNAMDGMPFWVDFSAGARANALVILSTLVAVGVAGVWPALRATRRRVAAGLEGGSGRASDLRFGRMAGAMVVTQIAISIVMLHGALVVAQAFDKFTGSSLDLPRNVLTTYLNVSAARSDAADGRPSPATAYDLETWLSEVPGVIAVGAGTALPRHSPAATRVEIEPTERPTLAVHAGPAPEVQVTRGYFDALDARALTGRLLAPTDFIPGARPVAVVSAPFARTFFGDAPAVGRRFRSVDDGTPGSWTEIAGVVPDLGLNVADETLAAGYYVPLRPDTDAVYVALRVSGDPYSYATALRRTLLEHDPFTVINRVQLLEDEAHEDREFFKWFSAALLGMGAITLGLALAGVYAMMSLIVTRRTREIGVRIALGATAGRIVRSVVGRAAGQVGLGGAVGYGLAIVSLEARSILVSRMGDGGAWTLPTVLVVLIAAGLAATWFPLRRALQVQAADALRAE
jgi:putative ABC transport system permease protein